VNRSLPDTVLMWIATGAGLGYSRFAPGTVGGVWGLPLAWGISRMGSFPIQGLVIVALCLVGVPLCTMASAKLGHKDPKPVVWDEITSVPITFFLVPAVHMNRPEVLAVGFILNRIFDILKLAPASQFEGLPKGLGIMADDWVGGLYSCLLLHLLLWFRLLPFWGA
jgi:phosphatidylglycerophosphatase A